MNAAGKKSTPPAAVTFGALVCHDHVPMALDCLGSALRLSAEPAALRIHDDGTLTEADVERLAAGLPGARFVRRREADERMGEALARHPRARAFRAASVFALKLFDLPLLADGGDPALLDSDLLFLSRFRLPAPGAAAGFRALFMRDREQNYSLRSWQKLLARGVRLPSCVNSGIVRIAREAYDPGYLDWFVGRRLHGGIERSLEQTAWAALGLRAGCRTLDPAQARVMREGEPDGELVAGHFTARTRHLLPRYAAASAAADAGAAPVALRTVPAGECTAYDLAAYEWRRLWMKEWRSR